MPSVSPRSWIALGALSGALTVALGAFGAHALADRLDPEKLEVWHTAVLYQGLHAPALILFGLWRALARRAASAPGALLALGTLGFSGSLYAWALGGPGWLVWVTPAGGLGLLAGWIVWGVQALRSRDGDAEELLG